MSFYGTSFTFNGHSCEEYGLMVYDFNNASMDSTTLSSTKLDIERIPHKMKSLFYGEHYEDNLEFTLVFGVNDNMMNDGEGIDRADMDMVAGWLTNHNKFLPFTVEQHDIEGFYYKAIITDLKMVEFGGRKWAFECTVHCDSPFAYSYEKQYVVPNNTITHIRNTGAVNQPYYPVVTITPKTSNITIANKRTPGKDFKLASLPKSVTSGGVQIIVDGENGIITASNGVNIYKYCNFEFPQLLTGDNEIKVTADDATIVQYTCSYPVDIGG